MKIFISGGCKNGKSSYAQKIVKTMQLENSSIYYLATMIPKDNEDMDRVLLHQKDREGLGFETIEISTNIEDVLQRCNHRSSFLLDSTTALLTNEMFLSNGDVEFLAHEKIASQLLNVISKLKNIVIVSDYIYSDAFKYDFLTEQYRKGLAYIDRQMAKSCDAVLEACYGNLIIHKGKEYLC